MKSQTMFFVTCLLVLSLTGGPVSARWKPSVMNTDLRSIYDLDNFNRGVFSPKVMTGTPIHFTRVGGQAGLQHLLIGGPQNPALTFPMILNGLSTFAAWDEPLACGFSDVSVTAFDGLESQSDTSAPNPPQPTKVIFVLVDQFDFCINQGFASFGALPASADELYIDPSLRSAFIHATVPLTCATGPNFGPCPFPSVDVDLTWTKTGKIEPDIFESTLVCPGSFVSNSGPKATVALANIAGDVSSGGTSLLTGKSITEVPPLLADNHITRIQILTPFAPCRFLGG